MFARSLAAAALAVALLVLAPLSAMARVDIRIDLAAQQMRVETPTGDVHFWPISSGRKGYATPRGTWEPYRLAKMHRSRKYNNAPMPHSIFFHGGYAIHATTEEGRLGRPASHGCIRLSRANAAKLFELVKADGAVIAINGFAPMGNTMIAKARTKAKPVALARAKPAKPTAVAARGPAAVPMAYVPVRQPVPLAVWAKDPAQWSMR